MDRNTSIRIAVLLLSALASLPSTSFAQGASPTRMLLEKAHTLEARGRMDMAAQTWQQVLLADPNNTEALGGLARSAKMSGNLALANTYLQKLRALNPNDPGITRAETATPQSIQLAQLQQAGRLAGQGMYAQAMTIYRQVFGSQPPAGEWSLAYYETEAATPDGRPHAITGLRSLTENYPQDSRYQIALGRVLTYDPKTRAEGRRLLEHHPKDPQATEALKQSLTWDASNPATSSEIRHFLQAHPDPQLESSLRNTEAQTKASLRALPRTGSANPSQNTTELKAQRAAGAEENAAFNALNAKRFSEADKRFQALLARDPQNARALAGLGYVRMNQQNFTGAISFLEQAKQNGARDPGLERNLQTALYYQVLSEGGVALNENDLSSAEQKYRQALQMRVSSTEALQGLGGTLLKAGQPEVAIPYFDQTVRQKPADTAAWRGLFLAEYQAGRPTAALEVDRRIPAAIRPQLLRDPEYLRSLSLAFTAAGRDADAQRILRTALDLPFPPNAQGLKIDTQLQYASLLLQANRIDQATGLYRQVLAADPENIPAWQGLVNAQHAMHSDAAALAAIESMPPTVYDQALREPGFLGTAAAIYQANNKLDLAQSLLERAIAASNTTGQKVPVPLQIQLAGLYLQRNDAAHAYPIYQRVLTENPERVDAWKGLLTSLHGAARDREALAQVQQIPLPVRKQLENDVEYLQNIGQIYSALGDGREAQLFLSRVQQHYAAQHTQPPAGIDIQNGWLLFNSMNDTGLYRQLLFLGGRHDLSDDQRRTVQTIWASWAVRRANQASAANNSRRALAILNAAARSFPDNPAVIKALASGYLRAGLPRQAVAIFKSQDMTNASASDYKTAVGAALAASDSKAAETWLRYALSLYSNDSQMLGLAAKFEQARGDSNRAADYYRASLAAMPPPDPGAELASILNAPMPLNPRALPSGQQSQDLAALLAPGADATAADATGQLSAAPPPRPYLPSNTNGYGNAPVQLNRDAETPAVPAYMNMRGQSGKPSGSRLGDYIPSPDTYPVDGSYTAPRADYPEPNTSTPGIQLPTGVSKMNSPGTAPPHAAEDPPYLAFQQEQIRKAAELANARGSAALAGDSVFANATFGNRQEGAQTAVVNGEVYGPYVPYLAPSTRGRAPVTYSASTVEVPEQTIITNFPTGPGKPVPLQNARAKTHAPIQHRQDAAAEAAEIRRHQSDPLPAASGVGHPPDDTSNSGELNAAQYNDPQTTRPGSLAPTVPTSVITTFPSGTPTSQRPVQQAAQQASGQSYGQQYPRPVYTAAASRARRKRPRTATAVTGFGPGSAPLFYPQVPSPLSSQPYPDLPPYNNSDQHAPTDQQLVARNVPPLRGRYSIIDDGTSPGGPPLNERQQAELDLATLEASYSGWIGGNSYLRYRSGTSGIDRLYDVEIPFEASFVTGKTARFTIIPKGVFLNSGSVDPATAINGGQPYLGTYSVLNGINTPAPQYASGVGGEIQMSTQSLGIAVGYTPYEFLVHNVTARFRYKIANGPITLYGERDSVRDTQLSYAGLRDPGFISLTQSAPIWGGVVSTGGGLRFDKGTEKNGIYVSMDGGVFTGRHVRDNVRYEGTMGAYFRVRQFPSIGQLSVGALLFGEHFDSNQRALSYGSGGYFSPNVYVLGSLPVTFTGAYKTSWHYIVQGGIGVQTFQEDSAPLFPLDPALQAGAQVNCSILQIAQRTCAVAFLPTNTSTGANFNFSAEGSYRVADHWYVGGALTANNTNNFNLVQPTVFLRYLFRQQYPNEDYPTGLFPPEGFRPLRVP